MGKWESDYSQFLEGLTGETLEEKEARLKKEKEKKKQGWYQKIKNMMGTNNDGGKNEEENS